jgi:hypothetical protein
MSEPTPQQRLERCRTAWELQKKLIETQGKRIALLEQRLQAAAVTHRDRLTEAALSGLMGLWSGSLENAEQVVTKVERIVDAVLRRRMSADGGDQIQEQKSAG